MATRQDFDLSTESAPNPAWLREYASAMKLEAQVLDGQMDALVEAIMHARPGEVTRALDAAMKATHAHALLSVSSIALARLADALEPSRPEVAGDPRGEADR